jgi:hypothetical protein
VLERALVDHYRCPEGLLKWALAGELSSDAGYFRFGPHVCYGQTADGPRARVPVNGLHDSLPALTAEGGLLRLPFDPSQVIDNLRFERYAVDSSDPGASRLATWQGTYYALRRFLPAPLRRGLQRTYLRHWQALPFPRWPVDHTVEGLLERLLVLSLRSQGLSRLPFVWFWPDGAPSCAIVTHDVETAAGRDRCAWLMDVDESHGVRASFQIVPEERYAVSDMFLDTIRGRGFEVNVHDLRHDGRLFVSRQEFGRQARRINEYARQYGARGFRSGSLHRRPDWYDALEIAYDMSIPNVGHLEVQRGGCCTTMPYFIGRIVELPLTTTQDYSLFRILRDFSGRVWQDQIEAISARHGLMSFIVHPDYLGEPRAEGAYRALLDRLVRLRETDGCWMPLPGDVERWWRVRSRLTLVRDGDRWRVEGPGRERARVAYAEIEGDRLVCRVEPAAVDRAGSADS